MLERDLAGLSKTERIKENKGKIKDKWIGSLGHNFKYKEVISCISSNLSTVVANFGL
jgi:hypothetical protein